MPKSKFNLDFVGVGAEKAGTTWIADCLREHPEVYIPKEKEIFFFNDYDPHFLSIKNYRYNRGLAWYARQFNGKRSGKKIGEISPTYLYSRVTAKRIKKSFPKVKIIVVLREPVKRLHSQYIHDLRLGVIKDVPLDEAVRLYKNYIEKGLYSKHLKNYLDLFGKRHVLVLLHEDLLTDPKKTIRSIYKFLGLKNEKYLPKNLKKKKNKAGKAKFSFINYAMMQADFILREKKLFWLLKLIDSVGLRRLAIFVRNVNSGKLEEYPEMPVATREFLRQEFADDIGKLEKLIGRDLSAWKK
jgi:hypothetical protein